MPVHDRFTIFRRDQQLRQVILPQNCILERTSFTILADLFGVIFYLGLRLRRFASGIQQLFPDNDRARVVLGWLDDCADLYSTQFADFLGCWVHFDLDHLLLTASMIE